MKITEINQKRKPIFIVKLTLFLYKSQCIIHNTVNAKTLKNPTTLQIKSRFLKHKIKRKQHLLPP